MRVCLLKSLRRVVRMTFVVVIKYCQYDRFVRVCIDLHTSRCYGLLHLDRLSLFFCFNIIKVILYGFELMY